VFEHLHPAIRFPHPRIGVLILFTVLVSAMPLTGQSADYAKSNGSGVPPYLANAATAGTAGTAMGAAAGPTGGAEEVAATGLIRAELPWWGWSLLLFGFTLVLGVLAVIAGVGGGVLFVPIVTALFPFHLDFVRGAGLMVALAGAISAAPTLLKQRLASLRMAIPFALLGSVGAIAGAAVGLALPTRVVEFALGIAILGIVVIMLRAKRSDVPDVPRADPLSSALAIHGVYWEPNEQREVDWRLHRMPLGLGVFVIIGFLAGIFGLGAGWANVPTLNLLLGAPLKTAVATSGLILSINDTAAAWVYLNRGAVLPLIAVPSVAGMMLGTRIGARLLGGVRPTVVRIIVIGILSAAGLRSILAGAGIL